MTHKIGSTWIYKGDNVKINQFYKPYHRRFPILIKTIKE